MNIRDNPNDPLRPMLERVACTVATAPPEQPRADDIEFEVMNNAEPVYRNRVLVGYQHPRDGHQFSVTLKVESANHAFVDVLRRLVEEAGRKA